MMSKARSTRPYSTQHKSLDFDSNCTVAAILLSPRFAGHPVEQLKDVRLGKVGTFVVSASAATVLIKVIPEAPMGLGFGDV